MRQADLCCEAHLPAKQLCQLRAALVTRHLAEDISRNMNKKKTATRSEHCCCARRAHTGTILVHAPTFSICDRPICGHAAMLRLSFTSCLADSRDCGTHAGASSRLHFLLIHTHVLPSTRAPSREAAARTVAEAGAIATTVAATKAATSNRTGHEVNTLQDWKGIKRMGLSEKNLNLRCE